MLKIERKGKAQAKSRNTIKIFNYIWEKGPVSRTDISERLRISAPSVTRIVESLIKEKFVREVGSVESSVGRKPIQLEIRKNAAYSIGISITNSKLNTILVNLGGEIIYRKSRALAVENREQFLHAIEEAISELLLQANYNNKDEIIGIGISTTGVINYEEGIIEVWNPKKKILDIPLKKYVEQKFGFRVRMDNNINVIFFGDYWFVNKLEGKKNQNLVCIHCSEGIASSIIMDGQILRGRNNLAGRIGHMTIEDGGRNCTCGQKGCLEAYTSIKSIEDQYFCITSTSKSFKEICDEANLNFEISKNILNNVISKIAIAVNNINVMINPEVIIVSGDIFEQYTEAFNLLQSEVKKRSFNEKLNTTQWKKKTKTEVMVEYSATALIYDEVLEHN